MASTEELYQLLKQRDEEIDRLRAALHGAVCEFTEMYTEDEQDKARERALEKLRGVYYENGLRSDGRLGG